MMYGAKAESGVIKHTNKQERQSVKTDEKTHLHNVFCKKDIECDSINTSLKHFREEKEKEKIIINYPSPKTMVYVCNKAWYPCRTRLEATLPC